MTPAATRTLGALVTATGRHLHEFVEDGGGCTFRSACGRFRGRIHPDGSPDVVDLADGEPGVPAVLVVSGPDAGTLRPAGGPPGVMRS